MCDSPWYGGCQPRVHLLELKSLPNVGAPWAPTGCEAVLPSRHWLVLMPTPVATVPPLELPHEPAITRKGAAAANRGPILFIGLPPYLFRRLLNSLGVWWQLSTSTFTDSPQPAPQPGVRRQYQASQPVRREDHDQDQEGAIGHGRTGVLEDRGDLVGDPVLGLDEL